MTKHKRVDGVANTSDIEKIFSVGLELQSNSSLSPTKDVTVFKPHTTVSGRKFTMTMVDNEIFMQETKTKVNPNPSAEYLKINLRSLIEACCYTLEDFNSHKEVDLPEKLVDPSTVKHQYPNIKMEKRETPTIPWPTPNMPGINPMEPTMDGPRIIPLTPHNPLNYTVEPMKTLSLDEMEDVKNSIAGVNLVSPFESDTEKNVTSPNYAFNEWYPHGHDI